MLKVKFSDSDTIYEISYSRINDHVIQLLGNIPEDSNGFAIYNSKNYRIGIYDDYRYIYRKIDGGIQFANQPIVWKPTISFVTNGGWLEGATLQQVSDYSEINVPTPIDNSHYKFIDWSPEIPQSGEITEDLEFVANFREVPSVTFETNRGKLEGETIQYADDYSEIIVPTPISDENYKFTAWNKEIPTEGAIEQNITYTALFDEVAKLSDLEKLQIKVNQIDGALSSLLEDITPNIIDQVDQLDLTLEDLIEEVIPALAEESTEEDTGNERVYCI